MTLILLLRQKTIKVLLSIKAFNNLTETDLKNIKVLNIGGTSVRNLKPLMGFEALEDLSIVNTDIKSIEPLMALPSMKHLKAYKTKIKNKSIELLRLKQPDLNIIYY